MNTFIIKFNTFQALAKYPEDWLIELLEQNADRQIIKRLILEKGHYMLVVDFKKDLKQAGSRKQLLNQEWQKGPRQRTLMPWILMPPRAATTSVSTAAESTLPKNAKNQSCSTASASSSAAVIRRTAPVRARAAVRLVAPRQKKVQHPGMRLKALKIKRKTRARAETGPSPSKECLWTRNEPGSKITKPWLRSQKKPRLKAPIWVC